MFPTPPSLEQHGPGYSPMNINCKEFGGLDNNPGMTLDGHHFTTSLNHFKVEVEEGMGSPKPSEIKVTKFNMCTFLEKLKLNF